MQIVEVLSQSPHDVGARVELAIRPEKVDVTQLQALPDPGALSGVIEQKQFLGNLVIYFIRLPWGQTVLAERTAGAPPIEVGAPVSLSWSVRHCSVFGRIPNAA